MHNVATIAADAAAPLFRRFRSAAGDHLLVVPYTRIFDLPPDLAERLDDDPQETGRLAAMLGQPSAQEHDLGAVVVPAPQSLSLNVSSSCNLSCGYCYADRGGFAGAQAATMTFDVARAAVERLMAEADPSRPITIGFLGGEPLRSRSLINDIVAFAGRHAEQSGLDVRYSMTTNGTLITAADIALFRNNRFAVTVSIDGDALVHDAQRPRLNGAGSFAQLVRRVAPLLADPGQAKVAARMTVRSGCPDLGRRIEGVWSLGFPEAGVAPLRIARDGSELHDDDWPRYLAQLIGVAQGELVRAKSGLPIRLTNLAIALKQIHAGASSPYSCGAGGGYFSVAADGDWYACHRAVGDADYRLGSASQLDAERRRAFLVERHVHAKTDCRLCWARYLCSGGCHQEARARSVAGCDFIRAWLDFCLASYCELSNARPEHFHQPLLGAA
ncbi:SPASM domain-containing protein [Bradyrhizobium jicamae]|uniref:radical SAM/SPASM domain-containing protein n=1 Tax=Bradyrhizobium jicamae TaxID=280332 RepID=UPI001BA77ADF|nr:radical SAM protein [Bradyrhizobium jicamae]MBR0755538.1 SPASM domain-containing protein [Bradyrhizobium jicamae]